MCGRARLSSDVSETKLVFSIPPHRLIPNIAPSWNVAQPIRFRWSATTPRLDVMRRGLCRLWAKDISRFRQH
jgi:hypothetical protein